MKKEFFKNGNSYKISIIGTEKSYDDSVTTLNCKKLSGFEFHSDSLVKEKEVQVSESEGKDNEGSDFETAIKATEYGRFNWVLLFATLWGFMSSMNATSTMSLILPSAECDLNLGNFDKGILNSVIYIGMTISAFFWGLLSDAVGRKAVMIVAFALDAFFSTLVGLAQNFTLLLVAKLFTGFISSGPMSILPSYLAENHANTYRASVIVYSGIFTSTASVVLPLLAWLIIPRPFRVDLFGGYISLSSWRIFLLVSAIPSVVALLSLLFFDESPKFLMFQGKNEEALKVFQKIYAMNTGKPKDTFPIKSLRNEMGDDQNEMREGMSARQIFATGWKQMLPMFKKPHFPVALLPCVIQFFTLLGVNTLRLWSPQLFASAIDQEKHNYNATASTICELLAPRPRSVVPEEVIPCSEYVVEDKVYFNAMITGVVTGIGYLISGYVVKTLEKKWLMVLAYALSIGCCFGLFWSTTSDMLLGVISIFIAVTSTCATALISAVIDIFPTSLRTTAVSLCMTFGRMGAMVGNLAFPLLLDWNCAAPFILLAVVIFFAAGLTVLLPKTKGKHLE